MAQSHYTKLKTLRAKESALYQVRSCVSCGSWRGQCIELDNSVRACTGHNQQGRVKFDVQNAFLCLLPVRWYFLCARSGAQQIPEAHTSVNWQGTVQGWTALDSPTALQLGPGWTMLDNSHIIMDCCGELSSTVQYSSLWQASSNFNQPYYYH